MSFYLDCFTIGPFLPRLQDKSHWKVSLYTILCHFQAITHPFDPHLPGATERRLLSPCNISPTCYLNEIFREIHPGKFTCWTQKLNFWKMIFLFKQMNFRFHVNFQGCRWTILFLFLFFGTSFFPSDWLSPDPVTFFLLCLAYIFVNRQGCGRGGFVPSLEGLAILGKASLVSKGQLFVAIQANPSTE